MWAISRNNSNYGLEYCREQWANFTTLTAEDYRNLEKLGFNFGPEIPTEGMKGENRGRGPRKKRLDLPKRQGRKTRILNTLTGEIYKSQGECARALGVCDSCISLGIRRQNRVKGALLQRI